MDALINSVGVGLLLSSLYGLRFRAWRRPFMVVTYFVFFTILEWIAAALVWRQEQRHGEGE